MAFAHEEGVDLKKVIECWARVRARAGTVVNRAPFMANNSFPAGFRVKLHDKDLRICRAMAAKHGGVLPVVESTIEEYGKLIAQGYGDEGHLGNLPAEVQTVPRPSLSRCDESLTHRDPQESAGAMAGRTCGGAAAGGASGN